MKLLITGANGFIGANAVRFASEEYDIGVITRHVPSTTTVNWWNKSPVCFQADIVNQNDIKDVMEYFCPDVVWHFAANANIKMDKNRPLDITSVNVFGTHNLLHHCPLNCKFLLASSVVVYPNALYPDDSFSEVDYTHPMNVYGATKLAAESFVEAFTNLKRIEGCSLRLCATVGGGLTHGIIKDFIHKLRSDDEKLDVLGACPGTIKPLCYVKDVIDAFDLLTNNNTGSYYNYNVVPNNSISVEDVANEVMSTLGITKEINWLGEQARWIGDNNRLNIEGFLMRKLGWTPRCNTSQQAIQQGIKDILEYENIG